MNLRTISVIALSARDFSSLEEKLREAVRWLEFAVGQGAELVVFPECLQRYCGDGVGNSRRQTVGDAACRDWRGEMRILREAAMRCKVSIVLPVTHHDERGLWNSFFMLSPEGEEVWRYDKVSPTPEELSAGLRPGSPGELFDWRGVKVGGLICFDTCFPENLDRLGRQGAQLVLCPSLWPGGSQLNQFCKTYSSRVALSYPAWSRIVDLDGQEVIEGGYRQETLRFGFGAPVYTATLNFDRVSLYGNGNQEQMVAILQKYGSRVKVSFDQGNCLWFLESTDPDLAESEILQEFRLVTAGDYFARCAQLIKEQGP